MRDNKISKRDPEVTVPKIQYQYNQKYQNAIEMIDKVSKRRQFLNQAVEKAAQVCLKNPKPVQYFPFAFDDGTVYNVKAFIMFSLECNRRFWTLLALLERHEIRFHDNLSYMANDSHIQATHMYLYLQAREEASKLKHQIMLYNQRLHEYEQQ